MTKLDKALKELLEQVANGREFPDAVFEVSYKHKVSESKLTELYDNE